MCVVANYPQSIRVTVHPNAVQFECEIQAETRTIVDPMLKLESLMYSQQFITESAQAIPGVNNLSMPKLTCTHALYHLLRLVLEHSNAWM